MVGFRGVYYECMHESERMNESSLRDVAVGAAREAGLMLRERFIRGDRAYDLKGERDIVAEADRAAESLILGRIRAIFPSHAVLSEESGEMASASASAYRWIVDPLDGTINFSRGIDEFCVSIALVERGVLVLGVVYEPSRDRMFVARRGRVRR